MFRPSASPEGSWNLPYSTALQQRKTGQRSRCDKRLFSSAVLNVSRTCRAGTAQKQAPSAPRSCSRTPAAPGAQRGDSQAGPGPEPTLKGDPVSVKPGSFLPALTGRGRASSAGLRGKYRP